jgi:hypothetical protein
VGHWFYFSAFSRLKELVLGRPTEPFFVGFVTDFRAAVVSVSHGFYECPLGEKSSVVLSVLLSDTFFLTSIDGGVICIGQGIRSKVSKGRLSFVSKFAKWFIF